MEGDLKSEREGRICDTLADAGLLCSYAVRYGVPAEPEAITAICELQEQHAKGGLTVEEEGKLYVAVNKLAANLAPVSAVTLRACFDEYGVTRKSWFGGQECQYSYAKLAVRRHHTWGFVALVLLLLAQIYWVIGTDLISRIPHLANKPAKKSSTVDTPPPVDKTMIGPPLPSSPDAVQENTRMQLLFDWSEPWGWLPDWLENHFGNDSTKNDSSSNPNSEPTIANSWFKRGYSSQEVITTFQVYILPLLYGWVGAMAYVLRDLIRAVQNHTFRREYDVAYSLRVYLGVLSGLAIGWFFKPTDTTGAGIASLTPFALSFVAGYSVELLFTAMDRLVKAFTGPDKGDLKRDSIGHEVK